MAKVRFTRSVTYNGIDYPMDSEHEISAEHLPALSRSVEVLEDDEPKKPAKDAETKDIDAAPVDKMVKGAPSKK